MVRWHLRGLLEVIALLEMSVWSVRSTTTPPPTTQQLSNARTFSHHAEKALYRHVTGNYDPNSRPVRDSSMPVNVRVVIQMKTIMDLDEKNQVLMTSVVVHEEWQDENISWDPKHFNDLEHLILPAYHIWLPDIYVYNNAALGDKGFIHVNETRAMVSHTGEVFWSVPVVLASSCSVNILYFPFDHQFCRVLLGSWVYDVQQMNLTFKTPGIDVHAMAEHSELHVVSFRIRRNVTSVTLSGDRLYSMLIIDVHIKRKALYYVYTVIAPSILLCVLTVFSFWLPCDCAQKIEIGLTVFLFLYFLQLLIAENTPESNSTPLIGTFLTMVMTLNSISLIMATLVMNIKRRAKKEPCPEVPLILWKLCRDILGKVTCTRYSREVEVKYLQESESEASDSDASSQKNSSDTSSTKSYSEGNIYRWVYVAGVVDKFLFEVYFLGTLFSIVVLLVIVPQKVDQNSLR